MATSVIVSANACWTEAKPTYVPDKVSHCLSNGISHRSHGRQSTRGAKHLVANLAALRAIAVEQMLVAPLADHQCQFPGEVECVLHPGIHALSTSRAMHVRSIAEKKGATPAVVRDLAAVDPETRKPDWIESHQPRWPPPVDDRLALLQRRCRWMLDAGGRKVRKDPISAGGEWEYDEGASRCQ